MDTTIIENQALHLSLSDPANLSHKPLLSLEELSKLDFEKEWLDEAERRAREIDEGLVQLVPAEEVSRKARELLGNKR
jgi:hypothetical protein